MTYTIICDDPEQRFKEFKGVLDADGLADLDQALVIKLGLV